MRSTVIHHRITKYDIEMRRDEACVAEAVAAAAAEEGDEVLAHAAGEDGYNVEAHS